VKINGIMWSLRIVRPVALLQK